MIQGMRRLEVDIIGVGRVCWPNNGTYNHPEGTFCYVGNTNDDAHYRNGAEVFAIKECSKCIKSFTPFSEKIFQMQLHA